MNEEMDNGLSIKLFENTTARIEKILNVELQSIIKDNDISDEEKMATFFKTLLKAKLKKVVENGKAKTIPENFNLNEYVEEKSNQLLGGDGIKLIENIGILNTDAKKYIDARGDNVKHLIEDLFQLAGKIIEDGNDENQIAAYCIEAGVICASFAAGIAAYLSYVAGAVTTTLALAAVTGGIAAATILVVIAIFAIIYTALSFLDKTTYGIIVNNTPYDLTVENGFGNFGEKNKMSGVRIRHGKVNSLMYSKEKNAVMVHGQISNKSESDNKKTEKICFVGLFQFTKKSGFYGSEGIIRFKHNNHYVDLSAACPMSDDNRMIFSSEFKQNNLGESENRLIEKWKNIKNERYEETVNGIKYTSTVKGLKGSPSYGIATASLEKK